MDRRATVAALLALTVVLAGCNFRGTPTTAPDVATETPTRTPTPERPFGGADLPPGLSTDGVTDVDALLSAHADALNGTSVTVAFNSTLVVNGTRNSSVLRAKILPDADRGWLQVTLSDGVGTFYTADGTTYFRTVVDGDVNYGTTGQVSAIPERPRFGVDQQIRTAITAAEWEPVGTVQRNGETMFEFRATSVDPPAVNTSGNTTVRSDGRLLVDRQGVVHYVSVSTTVETDRGTVRYSLTVRVTDVGTTTIEEPDWLENAE